mgnify:CR=1 FL=1
MTYVELIVVLTIFASLSTVVIFSHSEFQSKIDIKNLATDIAFKIIEAQKSATNGRMNTRAAGDDNWKPSYGIYIKPNDISFVYFLDYQPRNSQYDDSSSLGCPNTGECLDRPLLTKGNTISNLDVFYQGDPTPQNLNLTDLTISFVRPNAVAILKSTPQLNENIVDYVQIEVKSPKDNKAYIKVYASGKIEIN